jgi:hypothetical protein
MEEKEKIFPNQEQVRLIYKDTYNLYLKFKDIKADNEWNRLLFESNKLYKKYPFKLCQEMIMGLLEIIEHASKEV